MKHFIGPTPRIEDQLRPRLDERDAAIRLQIAEIVRSVEALSILAEPRPRRRPSDMVLGLSKRSPVDS
jgi:hypothetical protein